MSEGSNPLRDPSFLLGELERIAGLGTWLIETGGGVTWSAGAFALLDVDPSTSGVEALARAFHQRVHPDDRERVFAAQGALLEQGLLPVVDYRIVRGTGELRWLRGHGSVLRRPDGTVLGSLGAFLDITEARATLASLARARWALEESQRAAGVGTFLANLVTHEVEWSDEMRRLVGLASGALVDGLIADSFTFDDDRPAVRAWHQRILTGENAGSQRNRVKRRDGQVRWFQHCAVVRSDPDSGATMLVGSSQDVTEQLKLEEQLRQTTALEAVGTLAAGVAHDVNNALTVIASSLSLLERRVDASSTDLVRDASRAVEQCATLTQQLLAFARRQAVVPRVLDARELLAAFCQMIRRVLRTDITVAVETVGEPAWVTIDPAHLESALMNLAVNARDAMPKGGALTFRLVFVDAGMPRPDEAPRGPLVRIDVEDSGVGIDPEHLASVFRPYFTTKVASKGTGLGLASVLGTLQQNRGAVTVSSTLNKGSCFSLWLPREAHGPAAEVEPAPKRRSARAKLLVVDDMDLVRRSTCRVLLHSGYEVVDAANGASALGVLEHTRVDLVLSDLLMPGMDGRELARAARSAGHQVPFVFLTGYADADADLDALAQLGRVLLKPFTPEKLVALVEESLRGAPP